MASTGRANGSPLRARITALYSADMMWLVWVPVLVIGVLHYSTGAQHHWAHDVLRRLYYIPILFAAFSRGTDGGLLVAAVSALTYAPHAFLIMGDSHDPGTTLNKLLEIFLYITIGALAGILADREASRRRKLEEAYGEQRRMADQLVRAGRLAALGELVAGIAHEIKNPLHTIKGTAEIVDEVIPSDSEQAGMWTLLRQEVDRLERIAERFLSFARPSKVLLEPISVSDAYARVSELLVAQAQASPGIELAVAPLPADIRALPLRVDRDQLAQAVLNIAGNGIRAMHGAGTLRLSLSGAEDAGAQGIVLRLENDGPHIPETDLERIFDPFFTRSDGGTGLGLPIAERIAEAHGGHIEVENLRPRRGVAFDLVIPTGTERDVAASRWDRLPEPTADKQSNDSSEDK